MGHNKEIPFPENYDLTELDLQQVKRRFLETGWKDVDFTFHLGRKNGALDMQQGARRFLVYKSDHFDEQARALLEANNIPRFRVAKAGSKADVEIITVEVPSGSRALDSMNFRDQEPKTGHLGSFEILDSAAKLFAYLIARTNHKPAEVNLNNLALMPGEDKKIHIVPPYHFEAIHDLVQGVSQISEQLKSDLDNQDPYFDHTMQIAFFRDMVQKYISENQG